ncbi:MAG: O-antigen ligase domain-containing protein [Prochloraceae cyanobacterium]|nr:O-antigen ligase domain-containing protein [Prochloraceae cyanobacterium]
MTNKVDNTLSSRSSKADIKPENFPEKLVWHTMVWTYAFYLIGGLYIVGAVLAWIFFFYLVLKIWFQTEETPSSQRVFIPLIIWVWIVGMLVMEVALIMGHLDFNLPTSLIIKSSIGWAKGWAVLALYPLAGCLKIRPQIVYRAACIVCFHTLLLSPLLIVAPILHLPEILYVSPLKAVGGPGTTFFDVSLYEINLEGEIRQRLFAPWGPALGFVGNVYFAMALREKNKKWRWFGIIGSIYMCLICKSRLAQVCLIVTPTFIFFISRLTRPFVLVLLGATSVFGGLLSTPIINAFDSFWTKFKEARAESTRVRMVLKEIAGYRWETEAPIWGHGVVERGPHLVEYMPIGSHHTWYGLLFVKGIVGFYALAVPMALSFLVLLIKAQRYETARSGLAILFILFLYTFGENLEILAYLYWPGLVIMGIAFKPTIREK